MVDEPRPSPLVYLDVDDEITSAAARIRGMEGSRVALVLPYGSRLATSRINFRLLAREAAERGKEIEIVCADPSARALASAAGLPVHASVAAFEGRASGVAVAAPGEGPGASGVPGGGNGTGAGVTTDPYEPEMDEDTQTRPVAIPRRGTPVPRVGPPRPPVRTGLAVGVGLAVIVLVLVGGVAALELLPSATVVLAPRSEEVGPIQLTVTARPDVTAADPATLVIPAELVAFSLEASHTITATGTKIVETKATGNVTFSNFDTGGGVLVPAGTIVTTESDVDFATVTAVTLPRASFDFFPPFTVHPSTSSVGVEAVLPGESGNVGNNAINDVPKAKNTLTVRNPDATSGGLRTESPEISQADVDAALLAIESALAEELTGQIDEGTGVPAGVTLFDLTAVVGDPAFETDPQTLVGSASLEVELAATAEGTVLGVDPAPIEGMAQALLQARVREGWTLAPGSTGFELGTPSLFGDGVNYPVSIAATQVRTVDQAALEQGILGLGLAEARAQLDDFGDVEITLWPDWVTTIPKSVERITFTLDDPQPASPTQ